jgi:hypothetical protein
MMVWGPVGKHTHSLSGTAMCHARDQGRQIGRNAGMLPIHPGRQPSQTSDGEMAARGDIVVRAACLALPRFSILQKKRID